MFCKCLYSFEIIVVLAVPLVRPQGGWPALRRPVTMTTLASQSAAAGGGVLASHSLEYRGTT